jgi:hypothetical protein
MSNRRKLWTPGGRNEPAPEPQTEVRELDGSGPTLRLLVCKDCKSIEELPAYEGNPRNDVLLEDTVSRHMTEWSTHEVALIKIPVKWWNDKNIQPKLIQQISQGGSKGIEEMAEAEDYYGTRDTYRDDALKCFQRHQRPKAGCLDYQNPDKRIGNPTNEGWKTGPRVYACDFCPVQAWVDKKKLEEQGV